jgi:hypothetical protein
VKGAGCGSGGAVTGWAMEVSDCPRISASESRGGGEWARGGTRGGCASSGGGVELREELGALPIFASSRGGGGGSGSEV